jgi:NAD(P)H-dependent FMN reductase
MTPSPAPQVLIVLGSPRRQGNSTLLAKRIAAGATAAGARVETVRLYDLAIRPCTACEACRGSSADDCVLDDDLRTLYPALRACDALVIASPIYWFGVSGPTKTFIDRWYGLGGPQGYPDLKGKRLGVALAYADPDPFVSGAGNALRMVQDACRYVDATLVGAVYGTAEEAGAIQANEALLQQATDLGRQLVATV